jgi:hypothetical protein
MALAGKTAAKRNLDDRSIGFAEKPLGLVYPPPKYEAMRRFAELPTKRARKRNGDVTQQPQRRPGGSTRLRGSVC